MQDANQGRIQELNHSFAKTEHSFVENSQGKGPRDLQRAEEFKSILKWVSKRAATMCGGDPCTHYSYHMVKLQGITNLYFKKAFAPSKVHVLIVTSLINLKTGTAFPKSSHRVKALQESGNYLYQLKEPLYYYFYSHCPQDISLKVQLQLIEQDSRQGASLFSSPENAGSVQLTFLKEHRPKEKKNIILPNQLPSETEATQSNQPSSNSTTTPSLVYTAIQSQAYRYLEQVLPEHALCDPADKIAGIMGHYLPSGENAFTDFALTPEAQALELTFTCVDIGTQIIRDAVLKAEFLFRNKYTSLSKVSATTTEIFLQAKFHNGWKVVSSASALLREGPEAHLKTNNSNFSDLRNMPSNKKMTAGKGGQLPVKTKQQLKRYACDRMELGLVFLNEEECVLIYQLVAQVALKGEVGNKDSDALLETISVPLCFGLQSARALGRVGASSCVLYAGGCLASFHQLREAMQQYSRQISSPYNRRPSELRNRIPSALGDAETLSNNLQTLKTIQNLSQLTNPIKSEIGTIDFEMRLIERKEIEQDHPNLSLPIDNLSSLNPSKIEGRAKIQNEKERIAKQSKKKVAQQSTQNRLDITFNRQLLFSQHQRNQILSKTPPNTTTIITKQAFLAMLRQQVSRHHPKPINVPSNTRATPKIQEQDRVLSSMKARQGECETFVEEKTSKYLHYLYSNYLGEGRGCLGWEEVGQQVIKGELCQASYNNCYFLNFLQITNYHSRPITLPRVFYFQMRFYNQREVRSQLMTVSRDTGEILPLDTTSLAEKILHFEVGFDEQYDNHLLKMGQFIQFLQNGVLRVRLIDYFSGLCFGTFTAPLRPLIRKRRNEAVYLLEDAIYHRNIARANMKLELRAIRKMGNRTPSKHIPPLVQPTPAEGVDHRLDRIERFKQRKRKGEGEGQGESEACDSAQVGRIIGKAYLRQQVRIAVTYLRKQFFFLEVNNPHPSPSSYRIDITDPDAPFLQSNPLSGQQEITVVRDPSQLQRADYEMLAASKRNQERLLKCLKLSQQETFELPARGKAYLLLCYLTVRRFPAQSARGVEASRVAFNRQRRVTCSLVSERDSSIESLCLIDVVPLPEEDTLQFEYYRPSFQQSLIHLPFIDPQYLTANIDQLLADDPFLTVLPPNTSLPLSSRFAAAGNGLYLRVSNDIPLQGFKQYSLLLLIDFKKKQKLLAESRHLQSRGKTKSRYMPEPAAETASPKMVSLLLRVYGCLQFSVQLPLWTEYHGCLSIPTEAFRDSIQNFLLLSDEEESIRFYQERKSKAEGLEVLRVNPEAPTQVYYLLCSSTPNLSYIAVNAIEASSAVAQQEAMNSLQQGSHFQEADPFCRVVLAVETFVPNYREMLKININRGLEGAIEELFVYRSSCNKKFEFTVLCTDPSLVSLPHNDTLFQLDAKAERKITITFHAPRIIQRQALNGSCEGVVLGVKWDKGIDYFGFRFNIY